VPQCPYIAMRLNLPFRLIRIVYNGSACLATLPSFLLSPLIPALRLDPTLSCLAAMAAPAERRAGRFFGRANLSGTDESDTAAGRVPLRTAQLFGATGVEALVLRSATLRFLQVQWTATVSCWSALSLRFWYSMDSGGRVDSISAKLEQEALWWNT
jgi:hypothetical protein